MDRQAQCEPQVARLIQTMLLVIGSFKMDPGVAKDKRKACSSLLKLNDSAMKAGQTLRKDIRCNLEKLLGSFRYSKMTDDLYLYHTRSDSSRCYSIIWRDELINQVRLTNQILDGSNQLVAARITRFERAC